MTANKFEIGSRGGRKLGSLVERFDGSINSNSGE